MSIVGLRNLCRPAHFYLAISIITLAIMFYQNMNNVDVYCLGAYNCNVTNVNMVFIVKFVYILFWTWILNLICDSGSPNIAWLLVLLPLVLFFVMIGLLLIS
jgi:hypothetical protein